MFSQILVSILLIACGFLVKKYPNLIAGYNTMSQEEKDKVNIKSLSAFLEQLLIGLGIFTIISYIIFNFFDIEEKMILYINTTVLIVGLIIGLIYANINSTFKN